MNANDRIRARRLELGLDDIQVAKEVGLSISSYFDIELHKDEIYLCPELQQVKRLCEVLDFDFMDLFDVSCAFCEEKEGFVEGYNLPRNELVAKRRLEISLSEDELADRIGFEQLAVKEMERHSGYLETWPIDYVKDIAEVLRIPIQVLLAVKCAKCGR